MKKHLMPSLAVLSLALSLEGSAQAQTASQAGPSGRSIAAFPQSPNLRLLGGNTAMRTLVLLDGVPLSDPYFGFMPYSAFVPERLSANRVTRDGGVGAFGASSVAGTIEMASETRADLPLASAYALYGSRNAAELGATLSPDVGTGLVSISGRWEGGDGFQMTPASQRVTGSVPAAYRSWSASLRAVAPVSNTAELQARFLNFHDQRTLRLAGADNRSEGQDASLRFVSRGAWGVDALAYLQARDFSSVVISNATFRKALDQRATPALGLGGKIELRPPMGGHHQLRLGVDARRVSGDMLEDAYDADLVDDPVTARRRASGRQFTVGGFAGDDWTLGRVVLTGGARIDHWTISAGRFESRDPAGLLTQAVRFPNRSGWETNGRIGARWRVSDGVALRASAYTGFRLPTLNELYRGFTVLPMTTLPNAALAPEHLRGVEAGIDFTPAPDIRIGLTGFDNRIEDIIVNLRTGENLRQRRNIAALDMQGLELTGRARIGGFDLSAVYTHSSMAIYEPGAVFDGLETSQSPSDSLLVSLAARDGMRLSIAWRRIGQRFEKDFHVTRLPRATTLDAFARIPLGHNLALTARADNILDAAVITRNAAGALDVGPPRSFWIGIRFDIGRKSDAATKR